MNGKLMTEDNKYVRKEPCPECGSKDNLAVYSDGHAFCFGCSYRRPAPTEKKHKQKTYYSPRSLASIPSKKSVKDATINNIKAVKSP